MIPLHRRIPHGSFGMLPGLPDKIHGLRSQKSSLIMSKCSTRIRALALRFLSFSLCVFDCLTGSATESIVSVTLLLSGSTSSYYESQSWAKR